MNIDRTAHSVISLREITVSKPRSRNFLLLKCQISGNSAPRRTLIFYGPVLVGNVTSTCKDRVDVK